MLYVNYIACKINIGAYKGIYSALRVTFLPRINNIGVYPDDPKLKDLVYELKEVDWNQLGIQLNIPRHILRNIDRENPDNESRKLSEVLQYWIDNEPVASWEKIIQALQRISGHRTKHHH